MNEEVKVPEVQVPAEEGEPEGFIRIDAGQVFLKLRNELGEDQDASLVQVLNQIIRVLQANGVARLLGIRGHCRDDARHDARRLGRKS